MTFRIKCEALDENHAVKLYINHYLKNEDKVIYVGERTVIEISIAFDRLDLNNTLTLIDTTSSATQLLIFSIEMVINMEKSPDAVGRGIPKSEENDVEEQPSYLEERRDDDSF